MKHFIFFFFLFLNVAVAAQTRTGRDYAVFFYVTDFKPGWAALPETKTEAETLKKELEDNFNFTCELVANPTKQQMLDKIRQYNDRLTENDQVLFFFSMHEHFDAEHDRGYLIGKDGLVKDEYGDTWLNYDDLRTNLTRSRAKHVLLALDACHSGSFGIRNKSRPDAPDDETGTDCATKVSRAMKYTGRQYCTSGNKDAKTPAKSLFAARFLEALRKGGEGGVVRFDDLEYYLGKVDNPETESGTFGKHESAGDFVFVRKDACIKAVVDTTASVSGQMQLQNQVADDGFIFVQGGIFKMGCTSEQQDCQPDEKPIHQVVVSDFYISKYEVTEKDWRDVMGMNLPNFYNCDKCPVEGISWDETQRFIVKLNEKYPNKNYRLPTEAEWEYAARGGIRSKGYKYSGDYEVGEISWYEQNSALKIRPVGQKKPNEIGIYDMSGNVWEWCSDWHEVYPSESLTNPTGPKDCEGVCTKVYRGGSFFNHSNSLRVSIRYNGTPNRIDNRHIGFRLARSK